MLDSSTGIRVAEIGALKLTPSNLKRLRDKFEDGNYHKVSPFHQAQSDEQEELALREFERVAVDVRKDFLEACPAAHPGPVYIIRAENETRIEAFCNAMGTVTELFNKLQGEADKSKYATIETAIDFSRSLDRLILITRRREMPVPERK